MRVFDTSSMTVKRFLELLDIGLDQLEFVMIPQTLDQVSIGAMDLAKVDNKAHVYLIGVNDGSLPQSVNASSLITDDEKRLLRKMQISNSAQHQTFYKWMKHSSAISQ